MIAERGSKMIRLLLVVLTIFIFLILSIPVLLFETYVGKKDKEKRDRQSIGIIRGVFRFILWFCGVKVTVNGKENIPKEQAVLYVGNHRSYFDILVGYTTVPGLMGFVAKKEMLRYPILRDWMKCVNCLFLDRTNPKEGLKTILEGIKQVKSGISVWIFPEGTRNESDDILELLPFKEGSLKIAEKSGSPVIPVAITGTAEVFEKHLPFIRPSKVTVTYGEPIYLKELEPEQKKFSGAYTRSVIIEMLKKQRTPE